MPIEIKMPALSPTMEEGTLAKWLVVPGDKVEPGDLIAEIETDKATMEFEAVDEGEIAELLIEEGSSGVKVGTVIATMAGDGEAAAPKKSKAKASAPKEEKKAAPAKQEKAAAKEEAPKEEAKPAPAPAATPAPSPKSDDGDRIKASPLARRLAAEKGLDLASVEGSGPRGRIVKADLDGAKKADPSAVPAPAATAAASPAPAPVASSEALTDAIPDFGIPFEDAKLSGMRKTIAKRLTQSMQEAPHIYLTVDCQLDALLAMRKELNEALADREIKVSVNDLLIKALGLALMKVPECNVAFAGDVLRTYKRADVSVAVSIPGGLITPIVSGANEKPISQISTEMKDLASRAQAGKLQPNEYQGGTASISNMGMMGIKHFTAVINPPQACILAIGAGEKRPYVVNDELTTATVMTVTGSFDHRAIDGAVGAELLAVFKALVEKPLGMLA